MFYLGGFIEVKWPGFFAPITIEKVKSNFIAAFV